MDRISIKTKEDALKLLALLTHIDETGRCTNEERGYLKSIKRVDFSDMGLSSLPQSISLMKNLWWINMSNNELEELPKGIFRLYNLNLLFLSGNRLEELPEEIGKLQKLTGLHLDENPIKALPDSLEMLSEMRFLSISATKIHRLPEGLCKLSSLCKLYIDGTPISELPDFFDAFPELELVELSGLTLNRLPPSLALRSNLHFSSNVWWLDDSDEPTIFINGLTLTEQNITMFEQNDRVLIERWYRDFAAGDTVTVREAKIVFLGDGGVGKTYALRRLLHDGEKETKENHDTFNTDTTKGIIISHEDVPDGDGNDLKLHFWDFGGQTIMHSMHRAFLTRDTCYAVMVSSRNDREGNQMEQARYWLRTVRSFAPDCPVLLIMNLRDGTPNQMDETRLREEFSGMKLQFCTIDLKRAEPEAIRRLKTRLIELAKTLDCCGKEVSRSCYKIQHSLIEKQRGQKEYILSKADYAMLCAECGVTDESLYIALLELFNTLGVCCSYHRDDEKNTLLDYHILNPEWLTNAIYLIINQGQARAKQGVMTAMELDAILEHPEKGESKDVEFLKDVNYEGKREYILEIMRKHQLSYPLDYDAEFIPTLLPPKRPKSLAQTNEEPRMTYKISYDYLPDTVIQRLMVKNIRNLKREKCWRQGCVIVDDYSHLTAVVDCGSGDNTLRITVYPQGSEKPMQMYRELHRQIAEINAALNIKGNDYIVAEEADGTKKSFKIEDLLYWKSEGETMLLGRRKRHSIDEMLSLIASPEDIDRAVAVASKKAEGAMQPSSVETLMMPPRFKIAVSFSGKYRDTKVLPLCKALVGKDLYGESLADKDIFYDLWNPVKVNGCGGDSRLQKIYRDQSDLIVVLLSPDYKDKEWTNNVEWPTIRGLKNRGQGHRICLLGVDITKDDIDEIDGLNSGTDIFEPIDDKSPEDVAQFILDVYRDRFPRSEMEVRTWNRK